MSPFRGAFSSARSDSVSGVSVRLLGVLAVDFVFDLDDERAYLSEFSGRSVVASVSDWVSVSPSEVFGPLRPNHRRLSLAGIDSCA